LQMIALTFRLDVDAESRLLAEVDRIEGRGVLRVLDVVFLAKVRDGTVAGLEVGDGEDFGTLLAGISPVGAEDGSRPMADDGAVGGPAGSGVAAVRALADSLEPGSAVALLLVEHLWAGPLVDSVSAAGGALVSDDFLAGDVSRAIGAEIAAVEEASAVIAEAQAADDAVAGDLALISAADEVAAEATEEAQAKMRAASITRSEAQILRYLPQPVPFSVIAGKLGISRTAAKERAARLYQRLGVHSRDEAVSRARELGLLAR